MLQIKTITAFVFSIATLAGFAQNAKADYYSHLDRLACDILRQSDALVGEAIHYRHTPQYRHLVHDLKQIRAFADHIHEVAHHRGSIVHLDRDLRQLDAQFHHLEDLIKDIEHNAVHGHGHIHGRTGHVRRLLRAMENNIHHMQSDVRNLALLYQQRQQTYYYGSNRGIVIYGGNYGNYNYGHNHGGYGYGNRNNNHGHHGNQRHRGENHGANTGHGNHNQQRRGPIGKQRQGNQGGARFSNGNVQFKIKF